MSAGRVGARRWVPWLVMGAVVAATLIFGSLSAATPSEAERAQALEATIRCPSCVSQSVANSETPAAKGVKVLIKERIAKGDTDEQIRDFVASRYGRAILLDPSGKGFGALVWGLPVAAAIIAVGALVLRFQDWRPSAIAVTDADRDLVADALGGREDDRSDGEP